MDLDLIRVLKESSKISLESISVTWQPIHMDAIQYLTLRKFKPGDILFNEGEQTTFFYIIESGDVEVFVKPDGNQKVVLNVVSSGGCLGEFAFITKKPRTASAHAITDVSAYEVSEQGYEKLVAELPDWAKGMLQSLILRLADSTELIKKYSTHTEAPDETTSIIYGRNIHGRDE
jgi:CRP/FNR family cyclic AMP-dependent transcriptional regulator